MAEEAPPILIVGTGAMACLFAARLSAVGAQIVMLGSWSEGLQALRQHGVRLAGPGQEEQVYPVQAIDTPASCPRILYALVLVKSWQTGRAAKQLTACLPSGGLALSLQNGMGNWEKLAQELGAERVALGTTTYGATLLGPGQVLPAGEGTISLGFHPRLQPLAEALRSAGFEVETISDPTSLLWGKVIINAAINPLTAILRLPNGALLERPSARALMAIAAREAASVATLQGIQIPYPDPAAAAETVARRTAGNISSMLQDVLRGAPTEIDAICGAIVRAGDELGAPTPVNRTLWLIVKSLGEPESGERNSEISD